MRRLCFIQGALFVLRCALLCLFVLLGTVSHVVPAHASFGDCADPAYRASFDARLESAGFDCVERLRVNVPTTDGTRSVRLIHDRHAGWAILPNVVSEIERGVRQAATAFGQIGSFRLADVTILLIDDLPPREEASETFSDIAATAGASADACLIGLYLLGPGATPAHAAYVVVHEIFHCVQHATLDASQMSTSGAGRGAGGDWWLEGSADWFAALALPEAELLNRQIAAFDRASAETPLYQMAYEAVVFFLWRNDAEGPSSILPFLHRMAANSGAGAQRSAMAAALNEEGWLDFSQHYIDGDIKHPHGTPISVNPSNGETWRYTGSGRRTTTLEPFVLRRGIIEFDCGKWSTQVLPGDGHAFRTQGGVWGDLPASIDVDDDRRFRWTGIAAARTARSLQAQGEHDAGCEPCGGSSAVDECLVGAWRETGGGPIEWMRQVMEGIEIPAGERRNVVEVYYSDGSYLTAPLTAEITAIAQTDHATLRGDGNMTVQASGRWSAEAGTLHLCQDQLHSTGTLRARSSDGMDEMFPLPIPQTPDIVSLDYTCTDSSLETRLPIPDVPQPIVTQYSRIRPESD